MISAQMSKAESAAEKLRRDVQKSLQDEKLFPGDRIQSERELARRLNVSYMTLRRALGQLVEEGLLERRPRKGVFVTAAASHLNQGRARMRSGRVRALFYLDSLSSMYGSLNRALSRKMDEAGVDLVWSTVQEVVRPDSLERVARWDEDAFLIVGLMPRAFQAALLGAGNSHLFPMQSGGRERGGRPALIVDIDHDGNDADNLVLDNEGSTFDAAVRFFKAGHRRVAYVGALIPPAHPYYEKNAQWPNSVRRAMGVRRAYLSHGIPIDESLFQNVDYVQGARELGKRWFSSKRAPSAIVCFDCSVACGLLEAARESGVCIPRDVELASIGGPEDWKPELSLTHYAFDWSALGEQAAEMCLARLANPAQPFKRVVLSGARVQGETTLPEC